jgi:hypothetical protein
MNKDRSVASSPKTQQTFMVQPNGWKTGRYKVNIINANVL